MSSKVIVNILPDPFKQISQTHQDLVSVDRADISELSSTDPVVRVNQLEQNIKFLQQQHQIMLNGLHNEIETLRQKNRDLQFQILFSKKVKLAPNNPSSDEESDQVQVSPVQIEVLERNVAELLNHLSETKTKNIYLQNIIDEQKKKISTLENEKLDLAAVGKKIGKENVSKNKTEASENMLEELNEKLEDADRLIRRLRRENEEQRKEIVSLRSSMNKNKVENRRNDGNNPHRNYYRNSQSQTSRFPPLHNQPHWKNGKQNGHFSLEHQSNQNSDRGGNRSSKEPEVIGRSAPTLPYLRDRNNASTSTGYSNPAYNNYQGANHKRGYYYYRKQEDHRTNGRGGPRRDQQSHQQDSER